MSKTLTITSNELAIMFALISKLDPELYGDSEVKSLIYKSKAVAEHKNDYKTVRLN